MDRQSPLRELKLWENYLHKDKILKTKPSRVIYNRSMHFLVIYGMEFQEPSSFLGQIVKLVSWLKKIIRSIFKKNKWTSEIDYILPSVSTMAYKICKSKADSTSII